MDNGMEIETRLWDYIDGSCDAAEASLVEELIAENGTWKAKYHELLELHQLINAAELEQPSMRFTKNVMEEISKYQIAPATKTYINHKIVWAIALFFITVIAGCLAYGIGQINWSAGTPAQSPIGIDFTEVDYSRLFNNTFTSGFMMATVILGLMLLDRYLQNKKKRDMEKA